MTRTIKDYIFIALKGMGMGAADIVPGVSGGTIAFITGIYEELIESIKSVNLSSIKLLLQFKFKDFWKAVNGNFLLSIVVGVAISIKSIAGLIKYLLEQHPILIWSFFFGLIVASALIIAKKITEWKLRSIIAMLVGIGIAYLVTVVTPAETTNAYWFLFLSGALAICAMILPGISGAFILLLLGKYEFILNALSNFKLDVIAVFGCGAVVGLLSFSNLLSWLLKKYHNMTIALLSGFMIGSLNKVWPWKETVSTFIDRHGVEKSLNTNNILPQTFESILGQDANLMYAIGLAIIGFIVIMIMDKFSPDSEK
ncbi:MAG: putative membrane protein [Ancylomarina sp.]|jgi:putative membrane protein